MKTFPKIPGYQVRVHMRADVKPVVQPYRPVPLALEEKVEMKVQELLELNIIERVPDGTPPQWISPVVPIEKRDKTLRFCIDLRRVNEAVIRSPYPLPSPDYLLATIPPSVKFSVIDFTNAFFHFELDEAARNLTAFITKSGLYRFARLTMGLKCAPEEFTKGMKLTVLKGLTGVIDYIDDLLVHGSTEKEHDENYENVMARLTSLGIQISPKSQIGKAEVTFIGHKINSKGIFPTEDKLATLKRFKTPETKDEVKSFLGFLTFLSKFIPNLTDHTLELRRLVVHNTCFVWTTKQQKAFDTIKSLITAESHLRHFEAGRKTRLVTDASPTGIGAVLTQLHRGEWLPVRYISKGLSNCEQKYGQTEREALAVVWAVEKLHYYLFGTRFQLLTDCKVLQLLFGTKSKVNPRIMRWTLRLSVYDFEVVYIKGVDNYADALSRLVDSREENDVSGERVLRAMLEGAVPKAMSVEEIECETRKDEQLVQVAEALESEDWSRVNLDYRPYRAEICNINGVLVKGDRIIIPPSLLQRVLTLAHQGHPGQARMKMRLRKKVWFPRLEPRVAEFVRGCKPCIMVQRPDCPPPLKPKSFPDCPFEDLAMDFKQVGPDMILVVIDYYSSFAYYEIIKPATASATATSLMKIFGLFGIPRTIQCDNGTHFQGEVVTLCEKLGITLYRSAPRYPQANGKVERFNREIKSVVQQAHATGQDWKLELAQFLLCHHSTPHRELGGRTPAEAFMGRNIRDLIPDLDDRRHEDDEGMRDANNAYKYKYKKYTDIVRRAKPSELKVGDIVLKLNETRSNGEPRFGPEEFEIIEIDKYKVAIRSTLDPAKRFDRHPTHLKLLKRSQVVEEIGEGVEMVQEKDEADTQDLEPQEVIDQDVCAPRTRRMPKRMEDFVLYWTGEIVEGDDF